ncbi:GIY-YIG nuclease family protein [Lewinella sp. 4G2]|uniref:GIY-YIG nuclease family protein n=1 Tax=Lewinella sp. 4G2 TaxID=1803372 RepID=UPI0007B4BE17|nr:hypothetical protein A3850_007975 [Lewinella sp. 4G2]
MSWVYIIQSETDGKYYVGYTKDLATRVKTHNEGGSNWTKAKGPWVLRYSEEFEDHTEARKREIRLKKAKSHKYLSWLIENGPGIKHN